MPWGRKIGAYKEKKAVGVGVQEHASACLNRDIEASKSLRLY